MLKYVVVNFEMSHGHRCLQICQARLCGGSNSIGFRLSNSMLYRLGWETLHAPCDESFNKDLLDYRPRVTLGNLSTSTLKQYGRTMFSGCYSLLIQLSLPTKSFICLHINYSRLQGEARTRQGQMPHFSLLQAETKVINQSPIIIDTLPGVCLLLSESDTPSGSGRRKIRLPQCGIILGPTSMSWDPKEGI